MFNQIDLQPTYGRDYKSKAALLADWEANKDFLESGTNRYVNRSDLERYCIDIATINFRYGNLRKKLVVELKPSK